jgi:hypothetical protein
MPFLVSFHESEEEANKRLQELKGDDRHDWWVEEGTEHISGKCRGCSNPYADNKFDAHGISTGHWCNSCYNSNKYPYRKDRYPTMETHGFGECLEYD